MHDVDSAIAALGNEPPLSGDGRSGPPDRREVSARWLSGTFLTGLTSSIFMGVALFAALDGREQLATPPELLSLTTIDENGGGEATKSGRLVAPLLLASARDKERMEVSTMSRDGERNVVRTLPFVHVSMALAASHKTSRSYPQFDPLAVFAEDGTTQTATTGIIYGTKVESEVSLHSVDFPLETAVFDARNDLSVDEVERVVRTTGAILTDGDVQVAALHYIDPQRFGESLTLNPLGASYGARIVQENVSYSAREFDPSQHREYAEDIIPVTADREIVEIFEQHGYVGSDASGMAQAISRLLNVPTLKSGSVLRLGIESFGDFGRIMRASVYNGRNHVLTIALSDRGQFVPAEEPEPNPGVLSAFNQNQPIVRSRAELPTVYDGIYRAAFAYGLSGELARQLVRLLAADLDMQARLSPTDKLEVFFSQPDESDQATEDSEMLYVRATFDGETRTFYRFQAQDGTVDYFDAEGRSARQFLLRNPVPNGRFTSGFGSRRHPILGYSRRHTGVDWAAPRGTPIIASGNGTVVEAGWTGGYGRQTIIRHANGYVTSYSHQSAIAEGVVAGAEVRQGQVIGYVGSTGLSTGNHLHYELIVNGTKVDPMRVRLPTGRVLEGEDLEVFQRERERIDTLLAERGDSPLKLASR